MPRSLKGRGIEERLRPQNMRRESSLARISRDMVTCGYFALAKVPAQHADQLFGWHGFVPDESLLKEKLMSTSAISASSIFQELQAYAQQRGADIQQLGKDLTAGNLANAQQDYATLQSLGQSGPSANGNVFGGSARETDLNAIGQALQSGDLAGAQAAFTQLQSTFQNNGTGASGAASTATASSGTGAATSSIYQQLQAYGQQRSADVQQLGQDLTSGNVANALQDFNTLQTLGQSGPSKSGATFGNSQREQDLNAVGQALQSGNLAGAQQAFAQLEAASRNTNRRRRYNRAPPVHHRRAPKSF